ncbi:MAG: hypothetical protein ACI959_001519, partial [Limisphaerales bacterium]
GFRGSLMRFADKVGEINADGPLDLMTDFGNCKYRAAGSTNFTSEDTIWTFNSLISLKLLLTEELLEKFALDFYELNLDAEYVDYLEGSNLLQNLPQIMNPKEEEETMQEVELMGEFRKPKGWDYDITIADLKLQWNENTESWRNSVFTASILHIGEQTVNQQARVVAEFAPRASGDYFNIYLETDLDDWYYFTYRKGVLKIISSMPEYNDMVLDIDPKKATFKNDSGDGFSVMSIGTVQEKNRFLSKMGYFGAVDSGE